MIKYKALFLASILLCGCSNFKMTKSRNLVYEYEIGDYSYKISMTNGLISDTCSIWNFNGDLVEKSIWWAPSEKYSHTKPRAFRDSIIFKKQESSLSQVDSTKSSRTTESILKVLRKETPKLRDVYNEYLRKSPGFKGRLTYQLTISPSGKIIKIVLLEDTTYYLEFAYEISKRVSTWRFEISESQANDIVTVPFTFSS